MFVKYYLRYICILTFSHYKTIDRLQYNKPSFYDVQSIFRYPTNFKPEQFNKYQVCHVGKFTIRSETFIPYNWEKHRSLR